MKNMALARAINLSKYRAVKVGNAEFYIAETSEQHAQGLSGLSSLDKSGMIFVFSEPSLRPFHMGKMEMDINIAFYDEDMILMKSKTYSKHYSGPIFSPAPYKYVVETQAGFDVSNLDVVMARELL